MQSQLTPFFFAPSPSHCLFSVAILCNVHIVVNLSALEAFMKHWNNTKHIVSRDPIPAKRQKKLMNSYLCKGGYVEHMEPA